LASQIREEVMEDLMNTVRIITYCFRERNFCLTQNNNPKIGLGGELSGRAPQQVNK
jgi:hypothetical protein